VQTIGGEERFERDSWSVLCTEVEGLVGVAAAAAAAVGDGVDDDRDDDDGGSAAD
jgi:hypothetical protein